MSTDQPLSDDTAPLMKVQANNLEGSIDDAAKNMEQIDEGVQGVERFRENTLRDIGKEAEKRIEAIRKKQKALKKNTKANVREQILSLKQTKEKLIKRQQELIHLKDLSLDGEQCASSHGNLTERLKEVTGQIHQEDLNIKLPELRSNELGWSQLMKDGGILGEVVYDNVNIPLRSGVHQESETLANTGRKYWGGKFCELFKNKFKDTSNIKLTHWCKNVTVRGDKVLVPLHDKKVVEMYTKDGHLLKSIDIEGCPTAVEKTHRDELLISSDRGMFVLREHGKNQLVKVSNTSYSDICVFGNRVFSLDCKLKAIVEFVRKEVTGWVRNDNVVPVNYLEDTGLHDTLLLRECQDNPTELEFFICVWNQHTVYLINRQGEMIKSYGCRSDKGEEGLYGPYLCGKDRDGMLLIVDQMHCKYKILDPYSGVWSTVLIEDNWVYDAQIDSDTSVWCGTFKLSTFVLKKYEVVL